MPHYLESEINKHINLTQQQINRVSELLKLCENARLDNESAPNYDANSKISSQIAVFTQLAEDIAPMIPKMQDIEKKLKQRLSTCQNHSSMKTELLSFFSQKVTKSPAEQVIDMTSSSAPSSR
jgi:hypothetical protein